MNEQPSVYNLLFSYLLIPVITGAVITMDGAGKKVAGDSTYTGGSAVEDIIEIINTEANLPIYSAAEEYSHVNSLAAVTPQVPATFYSTMSEALPATEPDDKDTWCINISSFSTRVDANRLVAHARGKGVDATLKHVAVNGDTYWRVYVTGFPSSEEAESHAILMKDLLGLNAFWISRESGQSRAGNASHNAGEAESAT